MSEIAASDRPTFAQAFASEGSATDSQTVTPSTETTASSDSASAAAIEQPVTQVDGETTPAKGPVSYERFYEVNEAKKRLETDAQTYRQEAEALSWAKQVDRAAVENAARLSQLYQSDPDGFLDNLYAEASAADPSRARALKAGAARILARRELSSPQAAPTIPDVQILDGQGQVVGNLREIVHALADAHLTEYSAKELQPLKQEVESRQQREKDAEADRQFNAHITGLYEDVVDLPGFKDHESEIATVFAASTGDPKRALKAAYLQVVGQKLGNVDQVKARTLDELKTKAAASTHNPAGAVVAATQRPKSFHDSSLKW